MLLQLFAAFPTWEPFLLPGKLMMSVFPRIPHTGLQHTNTRERLYDIQSKKMRQVCLIMVMYASPSILKP